MDITPWEIYRNSAVGISLTNALNSMLENGEISTDQALLVLDEYDRWFQLRLRDNLAVDGGLRELSIRVSGTMLVVLRRSELLFDRFCWSFMVGSTEQLHLQRGQLAGRRQ